MQEREQVTELCTTVSFPKGFLYSSIRHPEGRHLGLPLVTFQSVHGTSLPGLKISYSRRRSLKALRFHRQDSDNRDYKPHFPFFFRTGTIAVQFNSSGTALPCLFLRYLDTDLKVKVLTHDRCVSTRLFRSGRHYWKHQSLFLALFALIATPDA